MQQKRVQVIVILLAAHSPLQAQRADAGLLKTRLQRAGIVGDLRNPETDERRIGRKLSHGRIGELVAPNQGKPSCWCRFGVHADAAALELAEIFTHFDDLRWCRAYRESGNGTVDLR